MPCAPKSVRRCFFPHPNEPVQFAIDSPKTATNAKLLPAPCFRIGIFWIWRRQHCCVIAMRIHSMQQRTTQKKKTNSKIRIELVEHGDHVTWDRPSVLLGIRMWQQKHGHRLRAMPTRSKEANEKSKRNQLKWPLHQRAAASFGSPSKSHSLCSQSQNTVDIGLRVYNEHKRWNRSSAHHRHTIIINIIHK